MNSAEHLKIALSPLSVTQGDRRAYRSGLVSAGRPAGATTPIKIDKGVFSGGGGRRGGAARDAPPARGGRRGAGGAAPGKRAPPAPPGERGPARRGGQNA